MSSEQMKGLRTVLAGAAREPLERGDDLPRRPDALPATPAPTAPVTTPAISATPRAPDSSSSIRRTSMSLPIELLDEIRQMRYRQPPVTVVGLLRLGVEAIVTNDELDAAEADLARYTGAKTVRSFQIGSGEIDRLDALAVSFECSRSHAAALALAYAKAHHIQ